MGLEGGAATGTFRVKYGREGAQSSYLHSRQTNYAVARQIAESFFRGGGLGGIPRDALQVWIENGSGKVLFRAGAGVAAR